MKLTGPMLHEAFEKVNSNAIPWDSLQPETIRDYGEVAGILYAQLFPDKLTYTLDYSEVEGSILAGDLDELLALIKKHGTEGDTINIFIHDEGNEDIGSMECYYKQDGIFLQAVQSYSAAIGLEKTLNEMEAKQAQASA